MSILGKAAIAPMLAMMFAIVIVPAAGDGFEQHGNNPVWLQGVSIADVELALPVSVVFALETVMGGQMNPASDCAELAMLICGEGRICCFRVVGSNGDVECSFSCQDAHGVCQPCWGQPPNDNT